jgi:hypothetical protein
MAIEVGLLLLTGYATFAQISPSGHVAPVSVHKVHRPSDPHAAFPGQVLVSSHEYPLHVPSPVKSQYSQAPKVLVQYKFVKQSATQRPDELQVKPAPHGRESEQEAQYPELKSQTVFYAVLMLEDTNSHSAPPSVHEIGVQI